MRILLVRHGESLGNVDPTVHATTPDHAVPIIAICHGVTLRAFVMMWCHLSPEWFEAERNPSNCAIRLVEAGNDKGYVFTGFPRSA